jgi:hypothetical protein
MVQVGHRYNLQHITCFVQVKILLGIVLRICVQSTRMQATCVYSKLYRINMCTALKYCQDSQLSLLFFQF